MPPVAGNAMSGSWKPMCIRQPTLSQQLGVLRRGGLIVPRKEGKQIFYHSNDGPVMEIMMILHKHFRCRQENPS